MTAAQDNSKMHCSTSLDDKQTIYLAADCLISSFSNNTKESDFAPGFKAVINSNMRDASLGSVFWCCCC